MWQWINKKDKAQSFRPQFPQTLDSAAQASFTLPHLVLRLLTTYYIVTGLLWGHKKNEWSQGNLCASSTVAQESQSLQSTAVWGVSELIMPAAEHFSKESGAEGRAVKALLSFFHISYQTKQREFMLYPHKGNIQTTRHWRSPFPDTETFRPPLRADRHSAFRNYQRCSAPAAPPWFCCALARVGRIGSIQDLCTSYCWIYLWYF